MSAYFATDDRVALVAAAYDFADSTAAVAYAPGKPIDVKRAVGVITEASAGSSVVTVAVRNIDDTGSTTIGTFTVPAGLALNSVFAVELAGVDPDAVIEASGGISQPAEVTTGRVNGYQSNQPGVIEVNPGQEISFTSDGGGTAGIANLYIEYVEMGNNPDRYAPAAVITLVR